MASRLRVRRCFRCGKEYKGTRDLCSECTSYKCLTCGKTFERNRGLKYVYKYCSFTCRDVGRKGIPLKGKATVLCGICGKPFEVFPSRVGTIKYCSKPCSKIGMSAAISAAASKRYEDPKVRKAQSKRTSESWMDLEKRANHLEAVRTTEHRRLRSKIARSHWEAPGSKAVVALRAYLDSPKFQEAMRKRRIPPPLKWRIYRRQDGTAINMRSLWEVTYATWLDLMGMPWEYEPERFELSDGRTYTPDFKVITPFGTAFVEVHRFTKIKPGDERKIEKLKMAQKELPLPLVFVGEEDMNYVKRAANAG